MSNDHPNNADLGGILYIIRIIPNKDVLHVSTSYAWRGRFSNVPQLIHVAKPTKTCAIHPIHSPGMKNQTETKGEFALISDLKTIKNLHFLMDTTR